MSANPEEPFELVTPGTLSSATIVGPFRYLLSRQWDPARTSLAVVMLNPSTADAAVDDPTIRRVIGFAKRDGFGGINVLNLYAFRATDPAELKTAADPVGPENDEYLARLAGWNGIFERLPAVVLAAWGVNAEPARVARFVELMAGAPLVCLGTTKDGHPRHPLYVRADQPFEPWSPR